MIEMAVWTIRFRTLAPLAEPSVCSAMRQETLPLGPLSIDEYLALEESATVRHELVAGRVYQMSGPTLRHNQIATNILRRLAALTPGTPCRVYLIDVKVRAGSDRIYYPDVVVACGAQEQDAVIVDAPCVIVEVTSPSTRRTDRGEKLDAYLALASLRGYLVVEHDRRHVTAYGREIETQWKREEVVMSGTVHVACLDGELSLDDVYAGVEMPSRVREDDVEWAPQP